MKVKGSSRSSKTRPTSNRQPANPCKSKSSARAVSPPPEAGPSSSALQDLEEDVHVDVYRDDTTYDNDETPYLVKHAAVAPSTPKSKPARGSPRARPKRLFTDTEDGDELPALISLSDVEYSESTDMASPRKKRRPPIDRTSAETKAEAEVSKWSQPRRRRGFLKQLAVEMPLDIIFEVTDLATLTGPCSRFLL